MPAPFGTIFAALVAALVATGAEWLSGYITGFGVVTAVVVVAIADEASGRTTDPPT